MKLLLAILIMPLLILVLRVLYIVSIRVIHAIPLKMSSKDLDDLYHSIDVVVVREIQLYNARKNMNSTPVGAYAAALHIDKDTKIVAKKVISILHNSGMIPHAIGNQIVDYIGELVILRMVDNASKFIQNDRIQEDTTTKLKDISNTILGQTDQSRSKARIR